MSKLASYGKSIMDIKSQLEECLYFYRDELTNCFNKPLFDRFKETLNTLLLKIKDENIRICKNGKVIPEVEKYLDSLETSKNGSSSLSFALQNISTSLDWYKVLKGADLDKNLINGLFAAQLYGPRGLIISEKFYLGLFLITPKVFYPLHQHEALELYYICSGNLIISHGINKDPNNFESGDFSLTPSNQIHSLKTTSKPCLLSYFWLPDGKSFPGKSWWWEKNNNGDWYRILWKRNHDSTWEVIDKEFITKKKL